MPVQDLRICGDEDEDLKIPAQANYEGGDAFDVWLTVEASDHHSTAPDMRNQLYLVNIIYVEIYARFE